MLPCAFPQDETAFWDVAGRIGFLNYTQELEFITGKIAV